MCVCVCVCVSVCVCVCVGNIYCYCLYSQIIVYDSNYNSTIMLMIQFTIIIVYNSIFTSLAL